jgi:hypothetical protein
MLFTAPFFYLEYRYIDLTNPDVSGSQQDVHNTFCTNLANHINLEVIVP